MRAGVALAGMPFSQGSSMFTKRATGTGRRLKLLLVGHFLESTTAGSKCVQFACEDALDEHGLGK